MPEIRTSFVMISACVLFIICAIIMPRTVSPAPGQMMAVHLDLQEIETALHRFHADVGRFPTTDEGIAALVYRMPNERWRGHYLEEIGPDPWGRPYVYVGQEDVDKFILYSLGKDGHSKIYASD